MAEVPQVNHGVADPALNQYEDRQQCQEHQMHRYVVPEAIGRYERLFSSVNVTGRQDQDNCRGHNKYASEPVNRPGGISRARPLRLPKQWDRGRYGQKSHRHDRDEHQPPCKKLEDQGKGPKAYQRTKARPNDRDGEGTAPFVRRKGFRKDGVGIAHN